MQSLIHNIRARPLKERKRIVYGSAFVVTLLISGVWVTLLQFDKHKEKGAVYESDQFAPLKSLSSGISTMWSSAKYSVPKNSSKEESSPQENPTNENLGVEMEAEATSDDTVLQGAGGQIILQPQRTDTVTSTPKNE